MKRYPTAFGVVTLLPRSAELLKRCNGIAFEQLLDARGLYEYAKRIKGR